MCIPLTFKPSSFGKRKYLRLCLGVWRGGEEGKVERNLTPYLSDLVETGKWMLLIYISNFESNITT